MATRVKKLETERKVRVFKSGNSAAVRLPAGWLDIGQEVRLVRDGERVTLEPLPQRIDLTGIYGSCPGLSALMPEDRELELRDLDWDGALLKR